MKACVLHAVDDLRCESVPQPTPDSGEVLIRIGACGVCGSDIPRVFTKGTYHFPTIPGHEFAGTVAGLGDDVSKDWLDVNVAVFPLLPCQQCGPCEIGSYAQCENYNYLGSRCDGAFAEYVCAPTWNLVRVPEGLSLEAAAMVEPAAVAAHAIRRGQVDLGDAVLIFGAGPIGLLCAQWARSWGAGKVMLVDIDQRKLDFAKMIGFTDLFNGREGDAVAWALETSGRGADVVVEATGSSIAYEQCMAAARSFGRVVLLGNPGKEMTLSQKAYWHILRKELTLTGSWNSSYSELPRNEWKLSLEAMADGRIQPEQLITHRTDLEGLGDAMRMMRDNTEFFNKVMFVSEKESEK